MLVLCKHPSPNLGMRIGDFITFFLEIPTSIKRQPVNLENNIVTTLCS